MKYVLPFETLPKGLPLGRKITYCLVDISGIQNYIFHGMTRNTSAEQLRSRSRFVAYVTDYLYQQLAQFPGFLFGTRSSGKLLCVFRSSVKPARLQPLLDRLQQVCFASTEGLLSFYYAMCEAKCIPQEKFCEQYMTLAAQEAGRILETEQKYRAINLLSVNMTEKDPALIPQETVDQAVPPTEDLAVVKLDLDNLGAFFRGITAFDQRDRISRAIDEQIQACLDADSRIMSVFAGGDDVFFLCPVHEYLSVVATFYQRLRQRLNQHPDLQAYEQNHFGLSAGISLLRQHGQTSLLLCWEQAESALHHAKRRGGKNCICVLLSDNEGRIMNWPDFVALSALSVRHAAMLDNSRLTGANRMDVQWLCQQLKKYCSRLCSGAGEKEMSILESIRIKQL